MGLCPSVLRIGVLVKHRPATFTTKYNTVGVLLQDMESYLKILTTFLYSVVYKLFTALVEVNLGLGVALLPPIISVIMIYNQLLWK